MHHRIPKHALPGLRKPKHQPQQHQHRRHPQHHPEARQPRARPTVAPRLHEREREQAKVHEERGGLDRDARQHDVIRGRGVRVAGRPDADECGAGDLHGCCGDVGCDERPEERAGREAVHAAWAGDSGRFEHGELCPLAVVG